MKQITFSTAILKVIEDFYQAAKTFSIWEVTQELRNHVNNDEFVFSDGVNCSSTTVRHEEVRSFINELCSEGLMARFDRVHSGAGYYNFVPILTNVSAGSNSIAKLIADNKNNPLPAGTSVKLAQCCGKGFAPKTFVYSKGSVDGKIWTYVTRKQAKGVPATLKSIQSRLKRDGHYTINEIRELVSDNGWKIANVATAPCQDQVTV